MPTTTLFLSPPSLLPSLSRHHFHPRRQRLLPAMTTANPSDEPPSRGRGGGHRSPMPLSLRQKISRSMRGRRLSATHRQRISERFIGSGNPMYGRRLSASTREKISMGVKRYFSERRKELGVERDISGNIMGKASVFVGPKRPRGKPKIWKGTGWGYGCIEREKEESTEEIEGMDGGGGAKERSGRVVAGDRDGVGMAKERIIWEGILEEVRVGLRPPEKVKKARKEQERRLELEAVKREGSFLGVYQEKRREHCGGCRGVGLVRCKVCAGGAVIGLGCGKCNGDGFVVCERCGGSG